jgi:polyphosphate kinase
VSERIRVRSIVGRFLEHSRVYWFANGGDAETWAASADWMERNLLWRVEVAFPLLDPELAARAFDEAITMHLADNTQAWQLDADGHYTRLQPDGQPAFSSQEALLARLA